MRQKICYKKCLRVEREHLTDIFCENGHDKKHCKRQLTALKRKHVVPTIITTTLTKCKQLLFLGYQKSDLKSKKKYKSLDLE